MREPLLIPREDAPRAIALPAVEIAPQSRRIGQIRHVLRAPQDVAVEEVGDIRISPRVTEVLYSLSNGERVVITDRRAVTRPAEADGVLQRTGDNTYRWLSHRIIDAFIVDVEQRGWQTVAADIAATWHAQFSFKAEIINPDGALVPGNEGLRPPQLGALHAIGAHWSLYRHQPATIVMPTGTGKTETMLAALAAFIRKPLLVVVPWDLLRGQTARKFMTFGLLRDLGVLTDTCSNPIVGIVTKRPTSEADLEIFEACNVVIATASSLNAGTALPLAEQIASRCDTLFIDEAHHVAAPGWNSFRAAFNDKAVVQFTATPFRRDKRLVDGHVIYSYPLRNAQRDGYFKKIAFEPIYEIDQTRADHAIAEAAIIRLREDLAAGRNHLLMARCQTIGRADAVFPIYEALAPDLNPMLIHSEMGDTDARLVQLRTGESRIAVCVNMLGEGFDLPELKIAAIHDMHKSLAILLQFTGRFTRTAAANIGDATVFANIADTEVSGALEKLYSQDADWNELLSELSSDAAREHAELVGFLNASQRLDEDRDGEVSISHQLLRPPLSAAVYRATAFHPRRFHEGLSKGQQVFGVWLHEASSTLFFVTRLDSTLRWTRSQDIRDREWSLSVLHHDPDRELLYLSSTDTSTLHHELAQAVSDDVTLISGDQIFRTLGKINRLIFQNVGVRKHGRRNLSFASYTGSDVATALGLAERAGSVKNNLSGTGWEDGQRVAIGCSFKGRVWARELASIPRFVKWCAKIGDKLLDDTIDTRQIIANVLIPEEIEALPDKEILGVEWPVELLQQSEERITLSQDAAEDGRPIFLYELVLTGVDRAANSVVFDVCSALDDVIGSFTLIVGGPNGFRVEQTHGVTIHIKAGAWTGTLAEYLSAYPPLVRFVDLCEMDGNLFIHPQNPQELAIDDGRFEAWEWDGVDITQESIWKGGAERRDSIQWRAAQHYIDGGFNVVFDDDSAGEAADLVCLKEEPDHIRLALVHCKFSGGQNAGERVKDVVEVCSQAVRSAKWKWRFRDLIRHILGREQRLTSAERPTRFLAGRSNELNRLLKVSRFKEIRAEILIAQPGLSLGNRTNDQNMVLAAALTYLKETIGADLDIICSP